MWYSNLGKDWEYGNLLTDKIEFMLGGKKSQYGAQGLCETKFICYRVFGKNVYEPLEMRKAAVTSLNTFLLKLYFEMSFYTFTY